MSARLWSPRSDARRGSRVALTLLALCLGGCPASPYRCDSTRSCAAPAVCAPTGYCAVAAPQCASGLRYTVSAADPDTCVPGAAPVDAPLDTVDDIAADTESDAASDIVLDAADASDASDVSDAFDASDVSDASDGSDVIDAGDASDVSDAFDASDVSDASMDALDAAVDRSDASDVVDGSMVRDVTVTDGAATRCTTPPRQLSPISGTRLGGGQVALRWRNLSAATLAEVQIARDPGFTSLIASTSGGGAGDGRAMIGGLPRGLYFWRVRGACSGDATTTEWSPAWSFWLSASGTSAGPIGWLRDLNGDGLADFVVGTPRTPATFTGGRSVDVYFGTSGASPFGGAPSLSRSGIADGFGAQVAIVPDMNGDGRAELAVSACKRGSAVCSPQVDVYSFAPASRTFTTLASLGYGTVSQRFGADLAGLGDVDGDGYGDLMIAAPGEHMVTAGQVFVVRGGVSPTIDAPIGAPMVIDTPAVARFGWSVAGVADVTADGVPDALVTSFERAWIFPGRGAPGALFDTPMLMRLTAVEEVTFGYVASAAGDNNGDGIADFALARPGVSVSMVAGVGDVGIYYGGSDFSAGRPPNHTVVGLRPGGHFGQSVAGGGNIAGALDEDLIVGAPGAFGGIGEVYAIIDRRPVGASVLGFRPGVVPLLNVGRSASIIGDFDGDGFDDFAFGEGQDASAVTAYRSTVYTWRGSATMVPSPSGNNSVLLTTDYGYSLGER